MINKKPRITQLETELYSLDVISSWLTGVIDTGTRTVNYVLLSIYVYNVLCTNQQDTKHYLHPGPSSSVSIPQLLTGVGSER